MIKYNKFLGKTVIKCKKLLRKFQNSLFKKLPRTKTDGANILINRKNTPMI